MDQRLDDCKPTARLSQRAIRAKCFLALVFLSHCGPSVFAQQPAPGTSSDQPTHVASQVNATSSNAGPWYVRDPYTGRLYQQQLRTVEVPAFEWKRKPVNQTVYEQRWVNQTVPVQQTVLEPVTQTVVQPRITNRLNPFRPPVYKYEYQTVTTWVPKTQVVYQNVGTQVLTARTQTTYVPEAVPTTRTEQQLVQTEVLQPGVGMPLGSVAAYQRPALINVPMLSQSRRLVAGVPMQSVPTVATVPMQPTPLPMAASSNVANTAVLPPPLVANNSNGLRPIVQPLLSNLPSASYTAPLRTATSAGTATRDSFQSGLPATVLR